MTNAFVWFDLRTNDRAAACTFYQDLIGWEIQHASTPQDPSLIGGGNTPWAGISQNPSRDDPSFWLPFVQVEDVDAATNRALTLGATLLHDKTDGGPGWFTTIADPSGAAVALWQAKPSG